MHCRLGRSIGDAQAHMPSSTAGCQASLEISVGDSELSGLGNASSDRRRECPGGREGMGIPPAVKEKLDTFHVIAQDSYVSHFGGFQRYYVYRISS
jgi:hypothetical protein